MELNKLFKKTSFLVLTSIFQFIAGILRAKLNAVYIGTTGVGVVNQLTFLTQKMASFTTLSTCEAVVKQIAENANEPEIDSIVKSSLKSYILLLVTFFIFSTILLLISKDYIVTKAFGSLKYMVYFFIAILTFPILLLNSIPYSILKGLKKIEIISKSRIIIIILNLLIFIPLVILFELDGAVAFVPISYLVTLLINYHFLKKSIQNYLNINLISIFKANLNISFIKELFVFSGFGLLISVYAIVSEFFCRSIVISNLGIDQLGVYSPNITWGGLFTGFLLPTFSIYLFPRFSELNSNNKINGIINDAIRLGTFYLLPLLLIGIPFRFILIKIFYSIDFIDAAIHLPFHFLGIVFYVWWYIFTQSMTPTGRIKQHSILFILFLSVNIIVAYYFVPLMGLQGWMLKHTISPIVFFFIYLYYLYKLFGYQLNRQNLLVMSYLLMSFLLLLLIEKFIDSGIKVNYFVGPTLLLTTVLVLRKNEKEIIKKKLFQYGNFFKTKF